MNRKLNCILLIDDDEPTNFLNKMTLEQADCAQHIRIAQSGQEALDYLHLCDAAESASADASSEWVAEELAFRPRPDLIFLDINMPAMDGWEFLERYRSLPGKQKADIVLIMLTTSLNPDDAAKTQNMPEVSGFWNKPLNQEQLDELIKKYFSH